MLANPGQFTGHQRKRLNPPTRLSDRASRNLGRLRRCNGLLMLASPGQFTGHQRKRLNPPTQVGNGTGNGFGTARMAERGPHGGQLDRNIGIAVDEVIAVAGKFQGRAEVGTVLGSN